MRIMWRSRPIIALGALLLLLFYAFSLRNGGSSEFLDDPSDFLKYKDRKAVLVPKTLNATRSHHSHSRKIILMWTKIFEQPFNEDLFRECGELQNSCSITSDRNVLNEASAVVFHISATDFVFDDLPPVRFPNQRYTFLTMEVPPSHDRKHIHLIPAHFFNWTQTYRRDSDVPMPYGGWWLNATEAKRWGARPEVLPHDRDSIMKGKSKPAFWLVSNCNTVSKRELAIQKLSKYITVDIYGKCARTEAKRTACAREGNCERKLAQENYFFIAVENTVCRDYFTEKYWHRYSLPSVPIVMRRHIYEKLIPPKSFIAMDDFESAEALANYLKYLMNNEAAYMEYFSWRADGWSHPWQIEGYRLGWCKLCEKLLKDETPKTIENIERWFYGSSGCESDEFARSWKA